MLSWVIISSRFASSASFASWVESQALSPKSGGQPGRCSGDGFIDASRLPASLDQEVGLALGAQAGEERLTDVIKQGGFKEVRRATETPFNLVLEARP